MQSIKGKRANEIQKVNKMKSSAAISIAILLSIGLLPYALCQRPYGSSCTESIQCRSNYCRTGKCINFGDVGDDVGFNPCAAVLCMSGTVCVLQEVQCVQFPCPPIASCERRRSRPGC